MPISSGTQAFIPDLRMVTWPHGFKPNITERYDGSRDPKEFLQIYSIAITSAGGDDKVKVNYLPSILEGAARSWLMNLPERSVRSWDHLYDLFRANFQVTYK